MTSVGDPAHPFYRRINDHYLLRMEPSRGEEVSSNMGSDWDPEAASAISFCGRSSTGKQDMPMLGGSEGA